MAFAQHHTKIQDFGWSNVNYQGVTEIWTPGVYYIYTQIGRLNTSNGTVSASNASNCGCQGGQLIIQIFPQ